MFGLACFGGLCVFLLIENKFSIRPFLRNCFDGIFKGIALPAVLVLTIAAHSQDRKVDFSFSPVRHYSAICLPYDWVKTVVTTRGGLGYDFGPGGPYSVPLTEISFGLQDTLLPVTRQYFEDARVPIAMTEFGKGDLRMRQAAFAIIPEQPDQPAFDYDDGTVRRLHGMAGAMAWAAPIVEADPAFRNVAWGTIRPVQYRVRVARGARKQVALGICEGGKNKGARLLELHVEGATPLTIDPAQDGQKNKPYVFLFAGHDGNNDGELAIDVHASPSSPDPNVYLNAFWIFPERAVVSAEAIVRGALSAQAEVYFDCGRETESHAPAPRLDAMLADFSGNSANPIISVSTPRELVYDATTGLLKTEGLPYLLSRPAAVAATRKDQQWILELPAGTQHAELIVVHGRKQRDHIRAVPDLARARRHAREWWTTAAPIPFGKIFLPDSGLQYVLEANLRNLYQIADRVDGVPQFQPGPSVYRGLFLYDILFMGEPLAILGDTATVRRFIEIAPAYQQASGQIRVMQPHPQLSETALFVYVACWYAELTDNKSWLARHFDEIQRGLHWLQKTREQTLTDPTAKNYGLMTAGFLDGGVAGMISDYSSVLFALLSLEKAIAAAQWLDRQAEADQWQRLYDEFMTSFRRAARRDLRRDAFGNQYLPITVADTSTTIPPQRGQWGFMVPLRYAGFFQTNDAFMDTLVAGNLAMMQQALKEGLLIDSGWLKNGVWSWFGSMHALTWVWRRDYDKANDMMYAVANHANPFGTWVEEQHIRDAGAGTSGDISNAEASAYFVNLALHLLMYEREDQVELLAGVPHDWYEPGAKIELHDALTKFGALSLRLEIMPSGKSGSLKITSRPSGHAKGKLALVLSGLKQQEYCDSQGKALPEVLDLKWGMKYRIDFSK